MPAHTGVQHGGGGPEVFPLILLCALLCARRGAGTPCCPASSWAGCTCCSSGSPREPGAGTGPRKLPTPAQVRSAKAFDPRPYNCWQSELAMRDSSALEPPPPPPPHGRQRWGSGWGCRDAERGRLWAGGNCGLCERQPRAGGSGAILPGRDWQRGGVPSRLVLPLRRLRVEEGPGLQRRQRARRRAPSSPCSPAAPAAFLGWGIYLFIYLLVSFPHPPPPHPSPFYLLAASPSHPPGALPAGCLGGRAARGHAGGAAAAAAARRLRPPPPCPPAALPRRPGPGSRLHQPVLGGAAQRGPGGGRAGGGGSRFRRGAQGKGCPEPLGSGDGAGLRPAAARLRESASRSRCTAVSREGVRLGLGGEEFPTCWVARRLWTSQRKHPPIELPSCGARERCGAELSGGRAARELPEHDWN